MKRALGRLFPEEKFALFFPTVGDAAAELIQRQTDGLAVLPDHLHDVRREVRQLERPGSEGAVTCGLRDGKTSSFPKIGKSSKIYTAIP